MNKTLLITFLIFIQLPIFAQQELNVVPTVQKWKYLDEEVKFSSITVNWSEETSARDLFFLERFKKELESVHVQSNTAHNDKSLAIFFDTAYIAVRRSQD